MRIVTLCFLVVVVVVAYAAPYEKEESYNVDETLENRRVLLPYLKCALEQGKCTSNMKDMKKDIRKSLTFKCVECTEKERRDSRKIIKHLINKEQDYWQQIVQKYDPDRKAATDFEKEFKE
ncbi:unnamed protein product [Chilo suppressalis]|uniref:Chemosensory protein n=1 Tax=Chilo suppressalis TaxID=168631 RepID=A0ABN8AY05_CHISP|nr:hypothetical protein evm_002581 [Chilo suppressalis]CAH0401231.1 unnamed protein product [Chilo suppressalis]